MSHHAARTTSTISRTPVRRARRVLTTLAVGAAVAVLTACSGGTAPDTSVGADDGYDATAIALSWIKNYEFAGYYYADRDDYYEEEGFESVELLAGGGTTSPWDTVLAGQAMIGLASDLTGVVGAIDGGAPLKIIGAQFVRNPVGFVSLAANPIRTVDDLAGKRIGVDAGGKLAVEAVLAANDLPADTVELVSVPSGIDPLMNGDVDALIGFLTNYPIAVTQAGGDVVTMSFADANYAQFGDAVVVSDDTLENDRDALKALMVANIRGWNDALEEGPQSIADIAMEYGGTENDLDADLQLASAEILPSFMLTPDTVQDGVFTITSALVDQAIASLAAAGVTADASMFDTSLLEEVFSENPDLIPGFAVPDAG